MYDYYYYLVHVSYYEQHKYASKAYARKKAREFAKNTNGVTLYEVHALRDYPNNFHKDISKEIKF